MQEKQQGTRQERIQENSKEVGKKVRQKDSKEVHVGMRNARKTARNQARKFTILYI